MATEVAPYVVTKIMASSRSLPFNSVRTAQEIHVVIVIHSERRNFTLVVHTQKTGYDIKGEPVLCTLCHQTELGQIDL